MFSLPGTPGPPSQSAPGHCHTVEEPLLLHHLWHLLLRMLQEGPQGSSNEIPIDRIAPGDIVGVHHPPRVEERQHHCLCRLMACTFAFTGPRVPFLTTVWTAALFCEYALCMDAANLSMVIFWPSTVRSSS